MNVLPLIEVSCQAPGFRAFFTGSMLEPLSRRPASPNPQQDWTVEAGLEFRSFRVLFSQGP